MKKARSKVLNNNQWISILFTIFIGVIISIFFDYYYDLNDDVFMKNIMAGVYSGKPSGHNIQMLFPISWFISLFYYLPFQISWYGLFLCGCQLLSIYLITDRLLFFFHKTYSKILALVLEAAMIVSLYLYELVFVQYTVTCTMLAAAAVMYFFTSDQNLQPKKFFIRNLVSIILVILAFQIRSEMLLLVFPLICVTGICKWAAEKMIFTKENMVKYISVFGAILLGMAASQGIHMVAYGSEEWQRFNDFFDSRTQLYDFNTIPAYEGNEQFYESIGMTKSEQILLHNYNFGMNDKLDEKLLSKISQYASEQKSVQSSFKDTLKTAVKDYIYRTFHETDYPFNILVIILYGMVLVSALLNKHYRFFWELPTLGVVRTGLWLYIQYFNRYPPRITHSLYLMEIVILLAILLVECGKHTRQNKVLGVLFSLILGVFTFVNMGSSVKKVQAEYVRREEVNQGMTALSEYTQKHIDNFYFWDVYSSVKYSEKLFMNVDNSLSNYDIMGGWVCKSPLMREKYSRYGIDSMGKSLIEQEHVYFVVRSVEPDEMPKSADWMPAFYRDQNIQIVMEKVDSIDVDGVAEFDVYSLQSKEEVEDRKEEGK